MSQAAPVPSTAAASLPPETGGVATSPMIPGLGGFAALLSGLLGGADVAGVADQDLLLPDQGVGEASPVRVAQGPAVSASRTVRVAAPGRSATHGQAGGARVDDLNQPAMPQPALIPSAPQSVVIVAGSSAPPASSWPGPIPGEADTPSVGDTVATADKQNAIRTGVMASPHAPPASGESPTRAATRASLETNGTFAVPLTETARDLAVARPEPLGAPPVQQLTPSRSPVMGPPTQATQPANMSPTASEQLMPALASMTTSATGTQTVNVQMRPETLGIVRIQVDQTVAGAAHVAIVAERPETLRLLRHDQPDLMRMLDQAGIPAEGRVVTFQMEPMTVAAPRVNGSGTGGLGPGHDPGFQQNGRRGQPDGGTGASPDQRDPRARWLRAGLDITA